MKKILKQLLQWLPFKKQLFSVLKAVWQPPTSIFQHLYFKGTIDVNPPNGKTFKMNHYGFIIENEIFWKGIENGWEKYSVRLWMELCKDAKVIHDIGANTGLYALLAKSIQPTASVTAFEPVERVFKRLQENVVLNKYDITLVPKAMSDSTGTAIIYDADTPHTLSVAVNKNISITPEDTFEVEIQTTRLDDYLLQAKTQFPDLIKLDVETHEVEALAGFGDLLAKHKPTVLIEILDETIATGVTKLIDGLGYVFYNIDENNGIRKVDKLGKSDYYNFLMCQPKVAEKLPMLKGLN